MDYQQLARLWRLEATRPRPDLDLPGSPERSLRRMAFEEVSGKIFILEQIAPAQVKRKQRIAQTMDHLHQHGLKEIHPYLKANEGHLAQVDDAFWMLRPYVPGEALNRTTYGADAWRGEHLADLLLNLRSLPQPDQTPIFSLPNYIRRVVPILERRSPDLQPRLAPVLHFLQQHLDPVYDQLPTAFCHGDYHPLNIIWGPQVIRALIDWEFCGTKPALYDAALLVGCVGFDEPENLEGPLVRSFLQRLRASREFSSAGWEPLIPLMLAIRIAWLREWIVRNEQEAADQELEYMQILMAFHEENMLGTRTNTRSSHQ